MSEIEALIKDIATWARVAHEQHETIRTQQATIDRLTEQRNRLLGAFRPKNPRLVRRGYWCWISGRKSKRIIS